jgi:hypothetical protein
MDTDCCENPNFEDCIQLINERDTFTTSRATYFGEAFYITRCANCGAVITSEFMSKGVNFDFDPKVRRKRKKQPLKYHYVDE